MNTKITFNYKLRMLVKRTKKEAKNMIKQEITLKKLNDVESYGARVVMRVCSALHNSQSKYL